MSPSEESLQRHWLWVLALGLLFFILGGIGLHRVVGLTIMSMFFFGVLLWIAGLSHLVDVFRHRAWKGALWQAFTALLYFAAGALVIYDPLLASTFVTMLLAYVLIILGLIRLMMAYALRHAAGWGWLLLAGLSALVLGLLILIQWPMSGLWIIGLFIAVELLVMGWTYIFIAFSLRH